jgi:twitching motility protein PilT
MKTIEDLLKNLSRPEVLEFGLVTNRLPSVNIGGKFEPVDDEAPTTERLMQMLVTMGGSRYVDSLSDKPVQWTTRLDGVGVIAVAAIMRKDVVQARFTVARREGRPQPSVQPAPPMPSAKPPPPPQPPPSIRPSDKVVVAAPAPAPAPAPPVAVRSSEKKVVAAAPVASAATTTQPIRPSQPKQRLVDRVSGPPQPVAPTPPQVAPVAPTPPQVAPVAPTPPQAAPVAPASPQAPPVTAAATPSVSPEPRPAPPIPKAVPPEEWEDDDEPTLQTLSPPVVRQTGRSKPVVSSLDAEEVPSPVAPSDAPNEAVTAEAPEAKTGELPLLDAKTQPMPTLSAPVSAPPTEVAPAPAPAPAPAVKPKESLRRYSTPTSVDTVEVDRAMKEAAARKASGSLALDLGAAAAADGDASAGARGASAAPPAPRVDAAAAFDSFLAMAVSTRASDLLVFAGRPVLLRVATDLLARTQSVSAEHVERIAKEIVPSRLREVLENEGSCEFAAEHPAHGRFRVNVSRQRGGFKLNLRVVSKDIPTLSALGMPDVLTAALRGQRGLILVSSPVGHGRSTTMAALIDHLNRETQRHIMTIEEPIEHVHVRKKGLVSQREVGVHARSKLRALESALRDDADVLAVADVSDADTARMALTAADTGRLVIAVMTSSRATRAIDRMVGLFPPAERRWARGMLASTLRLAVGQRLVPSVDRTRLHAAVEVVPWSIALDTVLRQADDGREGASSVAVERVPILVRLEDSLAELVKKQRITAEMARVVEGAVAESAPPSSSARPPSPPAEPEARPMKEA